MKLSILKAILYTLLLVVVWAVVELLVLLPYKYFVSKDLTSPELAIGLNVLATVAAYLSIFFLFNIPEDIEKTLFKFKRISYKVLLLILSLAIGMYLCDRFLWDLFNGVLVDALPFKNKFHPNDFLSFKFVLQTISIVCVSPFFEELFFRKFLFNQLLEKYNLLVSLLVSSILFSLIHIETPHNLLATFLGGLVLGLVYFKTKNVLYNIILHAIFNFIILFFGTELAIFYGDLEYDLTYYSSVLLGILLVYGSLKWISQLKS